MNEQFNNNSNQLFEEEQMPKVEIKEEAIEVKTRVCSNCNNVLNDGQRFCPNCGATVEEPIKQILICSSCGNEIPPETKFCPNCGKQVELTPSVKSQDKKVNGNKKKLFLIGGIALAVVLVALTVVLCIVLRKIPVEDIVVSESKIELKEEETKNISCTVYPEKATDNTVIWSSSDESVATVNSYGMITAVGKGNCTITVQAGNETEMISVTVKTKIDFKSIYNEYCVAKWASVGSDNSYLSIDDNPYDSDDYYIDAADAAIEKINRALGLPDSLYEEMLQTTWSMGKQSETYENVGVTVTWTYHPNKGLEVTYKLISN